MIRRTILATLALLCSAPALSADVPRGLETFDKVWTIVRDTHFDPALNGVDWEAARSEFRPRAERASSSAELRAVLHAMLARLGQSHFAIIPGSAAGGDDGPADAAHPGFDIGLAGEEVLVTDVEAGFAAAAAGVKPGWRLDAVGETRVDGLLTRLRETPDPRVRGLELWRALQARLRGAEGSSVTVTFADGGDGAVTLTLTRRRPSGQPVTVGNLPTMHVDVTSETRQTPAGRRAGVIGFNVWMATVDRPFQLAVDTHRDAAGIVVDLRGNPGGLAAMMMGIAGHFVADQKPLGVMKSRDSELKFTVNPRLVSAAGERVPVFGGPVAILVDSLSGSASECFSGGMQALGRVSVFGERTMGAALPSQFDKLPNGDVFIHATADFVTADGTRLEGRGVIPDHPVPLRRGDLLAGRDAVLDAALAWIDVQTARK